MKSTFDTISKDTSLRAVADEWREYEGPSDRPASSETSSEEVFQANLHRILLFSREVRREKSSENVFAYSQFIEAISCVASVESNLDRLLAVRDKPAVEVMEALQLYLDAIPEGHPRRRGAIHLIIKLAHRSEQLPPSLFCEEVVLPHDAEYECGGFGDIYQGTLAKQLVAIKKPRMFGRDVHAQRRLCREALVWRQLRHANILPFIGLNSRLFPGNSLPALLSPWMPHGSLKDFIASSDYDAARDTYRLMSGIAEGIAYLHSLSVTHGDINHINILIDAEYQPLLADFGLVRLGDSVTIGDFTPTANGFTLRWASPERLQDGVRSPSDDAYSYGCVSYYLHSGTVPFEGDAEGKTLIGILQGTRPPRPFRETGCLLEPADGVWDIVSSCWHQDASARPPMSSVCERLKTILLEKESTLVASEDGGRQDSTRIVTSEIKRVTAAPATVWGPSYVPLTYVLVAIIGLAITIIVVLLGAGVLTMHFPVGFTNNYPTSIVAIST